VLEELLRFRLPATVHAALTAQGPARRTVAERRAPQPAAMDVISWRLGNDWRPRRDSPVVIGDASPVTYGRLLHDRAALRVWTDGSLSIEILEPWPPRYDPGPARNLAYRVLRENRVIIAGDDVTVPAELPPTDDAAIRAVVDHITTFPTAPGAGVLSPTQRRMVGRDAPRLQDATTIEPVITVGSRITVSWPAGLASTTGEAVGVLRDPGSGELTDVAWRPDLARVVGPPWGRYPAADPRDVFVSPSSHVRPTIAAPDAGRVGPADRRWLAYGALVRSIDNARFDESTVRRVFAVEGRAVYEVSGDPPYGGPMRVPAEDVTVAHATAWPTIDDLLAARRDAGIALEVGEVLVTVRETTEVGWTPHGAAPVTPYRPRPAAHPVLDPDRLHGHPAAQADGMPLLLTRAGAGAVTFVHLPRHGVLRLPTPLLAAAADHSARDLQNLLHRHRPALSLDGWEPRVALAALAAAHLPELIAPGTTGPTTATDLGQDGLPPLGV